LSARKGKAIKAALEQLTKFPHNGKDLVERPSSDRKHFVFLGTNTRSSSGSMRGIGKKSR
jgi:hypothetical protein